MPDDPDSAPKRKKRKRVKPRQDRRDYRPDFESDDSAGVPLLAGTQKEHDNEAQPYTVPGCGTAPCPHCHGSLPIAAKFCVHCGTDLTSGDKSPGRTVRPSDFTWEEDYSLGARGRLFIALQFVNSAIFILMLVSMGFNFATSTTNIIGQAINLTLQAFLIGSYDALTVRRTDAAKVTILITRRIAFLQLKPRIVQWRDCHGVGVTGSTNSDGFTWMTCLYLLLLGFVPGIVFYWMVIRPERFHVALADEYGGLGELLYRTKHRLDAENIAKHIADITGLEYRTVL